MNRRGFLQLLGSTVALTAGGIALLEPEPIKTYFLPPRGGWATQLPGAWELELAKTALDSINATLGGSAEKQWGSFDLVHVEDLSPRVRRLLERRAQLLAKIDYLVKGGQPKGVMLDFRTGRDGKPSIVRIHGGHRSPDWHDANIIRVSEKPSWA